MSTFLSKMLDPDLESKEAQIRTAVLNEALPQLIDRVATYLDNNNNRIKLCTAIQTSAIQFTTLLKQPDNYLFVVGGTSAPLAKLILGAIALKIIGNNHLVDQMLTPLILNQEDNKSAYSSFSNPLSKYETKSTMIFFEEVILSGKKMQGFLTKYTGKHRFYSFVSPIDFTKEVYSTEDLDTLKQISPDITYLSQEQKKQVGIFNTGLDNSDLFYLIRRLSLLSNLYYGVLVPTLIYETEGKEDVDSNSVTPSFFSQALDKYVPVSPIDITSSVRKNLNEAGKIIDNFQQIILK